MTNSIKLFCIYLILLLAGLLPCAAKSEIISNNGISISFEELADHTIHVEWAKNKSSVRIYLVIDGRQSSTINAHSSATIDKIAKRSVGFNTAKESGALLWKYHPPKAEEPKQVQPQTQPQSQPQKPVTEDNKEPVKKPEAISSPTPKEESETTDIPTRQIDELPVIDKINQDPFFGQEAVEAFAEKCSHLATGLSETSDKAQFIADNDIRTFIDESEYEIRLKRTEIPTIARTIISSTTVSDAIVNLIVETLNNRLTSREQALKSLKSDFENFKETPSDSGTSNGSTLINGIVVALVSALLVGMIILLIKRQKTKSKKQVRKEGKHTSTSDDGNPVIVVRRKTTSILKKQSLEDVVNNPTYLVINSSDFAQDSAVRTIYIKNTCIKEVYNLYAEDLRNSGNPKEDGCMVLGRWVFDETTRTYDISLENVVFPGDDAVFKEYELNFGGKIKLRIAEKLRKLRRDTNLQYDLVCWIHSHPGLGVFFSNSDDNVQAQLKHSQHPNFLIAFVIDILTADQELGIFTFRKDGIMNSKGDLTKMYSLEEMYKWALESDKMSFNPDNCYNILASAKMKTASCRGIELNNSSIIDLTRLAVEPLTGIVGWAIGTTIESGRGSEYVVSSIVRDADKPTSGKIGAVITVSHFSLPTIQRLIANESKRINFVIVYSTKLMTLTSIPVVNGELIADEQYYGDETIEDLKIWTRRKR